MVNFPKNPFKNVGIVQNIINVDTSFFKDKVAFYNPTPNSNFVSEELIQKNKNPDPEKQIFFWLWRIQRYFLNNVMGEDPNSRNNTVEQIIGFLRTIETMEPKYLSYFCMEDSALNCLIFSLLLCRERDVWERVLKIIKDRRGPCDLLAILDWCFSYYFDQSPPSCELVLSRMMAQQGNLKFCLPDSPASTVFQCVALSSWYIKQPDKHPESCLQALIPVAKDIEPACRQS